MIDCDGMFGRSRLPCMPCSLSVDGRDKECFSAHSCDRLSFSFMISEKRCVFSRMERWLIEQSLQTMLFQRAVRGAVLTREGRELFASVLEIFEKIESIQKRVHGQSREIRGTVRFAFSPLILHSVLILLLPELRVAFPDVQFTMEHGSRGRYLPAFPGHCQPHAGFCQACGRQREGPEVLSVLFVAAGAVHARRHDGGNWGIPWT